MLTCRASSTGAGSSTGTSKRERRADRADRRERTDHVRRAGRLVNQADTSFASWGVRAEERVLLLGDSVDFVGLWYGAQKIGAVTAEAYTFLHEGLRVLPRVHARRCRRRRSHDRAGDPRGGGGALAAQVLVVDDEYHARLRDLPDQLEAAPTTKTTLQSGSSRPARPDSRRRPSIRSTARAQLRVVREGRPRPPRRGCRPPVPKLFFGYARDLAALFLRRRRREIVFPSGRRPRRIFELIAEHADGPRQRSDDDGSDGRPPRTRSLVPSLLHPPPVRRCRRTSTTAGSRSSASRCWTGSARARRTTSTSPTDPARAPRLDGRARPRLRRANRRQR